MPADDSTPDESTTSPSSRPPGGSSAVGAVPAPTWWESINGPSASAGAWSPSAPSSLHLTAPASTGWMPPPSSFHSLAHGSSLPTAGAEPGEAAKAAAAAAATVAGDAIEAAQTTAGDTLASAEATAQLAADAGRSTAADLRASVRSAAQDTAVDPATLPELRAAVLGGRTEAPEPRSAVHSSFAGAVRPYDESVVRSMVAGSFPQQTASLEAAARGPIARARAATGGPPSPARAAGTVRQSGIAVGVAVALGALMAFFVLLGDFDAGPDESAGFAVGILLTAIAQVALLVWALVLVLRKVGDPPGSLARPGRAIWITLLLSPVPLFFLRAFLGMLDTL